MHRRRIKLRSLNRRNFELVVFTAAALHHVHKPRSIPHTFLFRLAVSGLFFLLLFPLTIKGLLAAFSGALAITTCSILLPIKPKDRHRPPAGGTYLLSLAIFALACKAPIIIHAITLLTLALAIAIIYCVAVQKRPLNSSALLLTANAVAGMLLGIPAALVAAIPGLHFSALFIALTSFSYAQAAQLGNLVTLRKQLAFA